MPKVKLGDVAREYKSTLKQTAGLPVVGLEHITPGELQLENWDQDIETTFTKGFKKGHVLFGRRRAYLKKAAVAPFDGVCSGDITVIEAIPGKILPSLLPFVIQNDMLFDFAVGKSAGSLSPRVKWENLRSYEFSLPEYDMQESMVELLQAAYKAKRAYQKQITATDELVKSQFIEFFGDPFTNEKNWKDGTIGDYFSVKGGKRIPKGMTFSSETTVHPYLRTTDMKNGTILDDDIHYIDDDVFQHITRYTVAGGDIYMTNVGVNLGMAGIIPEKYDGASLTENAVKLLPKTDELIPEFVSSYINMPQVQKYIEERKMAVGVPKLAIFRIESMPIIIPPKTSQQGFLDFVHQSDKSKFELQESIKRVDGLIKSLMQNEQ